MARHEVLRTTFVVEDCERQRIGPADVGLPLKRDDLTAAARVEATLGDLMYHEAQAALGGRTTDPRSLAVEDHMLLITTAVGGAGPKS